MEPQDHLAAIGREGERLVAAAAAAPEAPVPACPGWDNTRLLGHTLRVWGSTAWILENRAQDAPSRDSAPPRPGPGEAVDAARDQLARLTTALAATDPDTELWSWGSLSTARFYFRRMSHETLVHRIDAEQATGEVSPIDPGQATDCIDELFDELLGADPLPTGSLHLHRTDGDGEWLLDTADGRIVVTREHAKGDAALRGSAADLMMAVWSRRQLDGMELFGEASVVESWIALAP